MGKITVDIAILYFSPLWHTWVGLWVPYREILDIYVQFVKFLFPLGWCKLCAMARQHTFWLCNTGCSHLLICWDMTLWWQYIMHTALYVLWMCPSTPCILHPFHQQEVGQTVLRHITVQALMVNGFCFPQLNFLWGISHVEMCHQEIIFLTCLPTFLIKNVLANCAMHLLLAAWPSKAWTKVIIFFSKLAGRMGLQNV